MKSNTFSNWWSMVFNGLIALVFGILATFYPVSTLMGVIIWFGIIIIVVGIAMLFVALNNRKNKLPYTADLIWSILILLVGLVLTFYTERSVQIFFTLIGVWAIFVGGVQLFQVSKIGDDATSKNGLLLNGVITVVFGVLLIIFPITSASIVLVISGVLALISGALLIVLGMKLKNLTKE